jgi:coenzyme F420-0:L-glutamate ligase/coenzyme F420-1:gamma-L-glutamate ligase
MRAGIVEPEKSADRLMKLASLVLTALPAIPSVQQGMDLAGVILNASAGAHLAVKDLDVFVVAQKIVSKAEGRKVRLRDVEPRAEALRLAGECQKDPRIVELILRESSAVLRCRPNLLIVVHRLGFVLANAGIDASNVDSKDGEEAVLLLPQDPDESAARLRRAIERKTGAKVGVIVNDSFGRAWRLGTVGTAIGVAGLPAVADLRGRPDRNGRLLQSTEVGIADELAAAASSLMGQADEGLPVVHIRGFSISGEGRAADLVRPPQLDLFR